MWILLNIAIAPLAFLTGASRQPVGSLIPMVGMVGLTLGLNWIDKLQPEIAFIGMAAGAILGVEKYVRNREKELS